ncbi:MAG: response regulator receiver modulated diguanylate phosphodiesterase [Frankiales bacterium]|nr:response regulator receiver modulated diguanylate phosphodiesterase [Frankiales bacterium]
MSSQQAYTDRLVHRPVRWTERLVRRPGRWALPPMPPETWVGHRASPLLAVGAAIAVAVPELILFRGTGPARLELAIAYAVGGLLALVSAYLLVIQSAIAQDRRLIWGGGGFALLLLVDLARSLAGGSADAERGLSLTWLVVLPLVMATVTLIRWGLPLLVLPAVVVAILGLLAGWLAPGSQVALPAAVVAVGAGIWWLRQPVAEDRDAWVWPGLACLLLPAAAAARFLNSSTLNGAMVEDLVLAVPAAGLGVVSYGGYLRQARRWRRLEQEVRTLRISALLPGLSVTPADVAGLPAENEMATLIADVVPQIALQPVVSLATGETRGQEALSRFGSRVPTERWFRGAALHGLGADLERLTLKAALGSLDLIPPGQFLAVNVSPASLYDREVIRLLDETDLSRLVIEVTEHDAINDYDDTRRYLGRLRARGARIAVDDVGAGYASLRHLLLLQPDMIKLDTSLTRDVHKSPKQQSMVRALVGFADEVGAVVLAEGVEIAEQVPPLLEAGVALGQGWHLGLPVVTT